MKTARFAVAGLLVVAFALSLGLTAGCGQKEEFAITPTAMEAVKAEFPHATVAEDGIDLVLGQQTIQLLDAWWRPGHRRT